MQFLRLQFQEVRFNFFLYFSGYLNPLNNGEETVIIDQSYTKNNADLTNQTREEEINVGTLEFAPNPLEQ